MNISFEVITALYILSILALFSLTLVAAKTRNTLSAHAACKPMATYNSSQTYDAYEHSYKGNLFTHPDEASCELTQATMYQDLILDGHNDEREFDLVIPAPHGGWTHGHIVHIIESRNMTLWNARLGSIWIGSSEV